MTISNRAARDFQPDFDFSGPRPKPTRLRVREAYYHFVNIEEHPEVLPLAFDVAQQRLADAVQAPFLHRSAADQGSSGSVAPSLEELLERLSSTAPRYVRPWRHEREDLTRRQVLHYFMQFMPTALVDGCWLQCGLRVCTAQSVTGAAMSALYAHQVRAFIEDPGRHFVGDYRGAYARLGSPVEEVSSHSFTQRSDLDDASFVLPGFLLAIGQFARTCPAEILGVNLAWQFLDLSAFGPALIRDLCSAYALPPLGDDLGQSEYLEKSRQLARESIATLLAGVEPDEREETWAKVVAGATAALTAWETWYTHTSGTAPKGPPDPRQEMLDLLWRKAPHASGYHAEKKLGEKRIDEHLDPHAFDGPTLLDELARSRWVKPGRSERSGMLSHLVKFGGPMLAVFSPVELEIIERWIDSLPPRDAVDGSSAVERTPSPKGPTIVTEAYFDGRAWTPGAFRQRGQQRFGSCSTRDLFHHLINVERNPEILPIAEKFARDRLAASMAKLWTGERPIPSRRYDPIALERWVHKRHRDQVDSYRPPALRPPVQREAFIEGSVQLAPIVLIDGGWLQGIATPALIHTHVGRMLFHVLVEEIGSGKAEEHHANVYRELLAAMGEAAPPVESVEFAHWSRLDDASFEVPTLWLSMSCFTRHFLPEILGLNLAVELAGIGGPYMEARDALKSFGLPTLFVDVHNAADNIAAGHSAWAMNSIKRFLDEVAEREGPHSVDRTWHRVWSGVRATLPQIGRLRLMAHRLGRRLFGEDPTAVPVIFPS